MGSWNVRVLLPLVVVTVTLLATLLWASAVPSVAGGPPPPPNSKVPTPNPKSNEYVEVAAPDMPVVIKDKDGKVLLKTTQQYFQEHLPEIEKQLNIYLGSGTRPAPYIPPTPIVGATPTPTPPVRAPAGR